MKLQRSLIALTALMFAGTATAQTSTEPQEGDTALFLSNISAFPMYNVGYFLSNDLMGYGSLAFSNNDNDSGVAFGLGARIYGAPGTSEHIRTYWNADLQHTTEGFSGGSSSALASLGSFGGTSDVTTVAADFGAEFELAPRATLGAQVGIQVQSMDGPQGGSMTQFNIGTADILLNYYF